MCVSNLKLFQYDSKFVSSAVALFSMDLSLKGVSKVTRRIVVQALAHLRQIRV
jgi:hypothetical protein